MKDGAGQQGGEDGGGGDKGAALRRRDGDGPQVERDHIQKKAEAARQEKERDIARRGRAGALYGQDGDEGEGRYRIAQEAEDEGRKTAQGKPGEHIGESPERYGAQRADMICRTAFHTRPSPL